MTLAQNGKDLDPGTLRVARAQFENAPIDYYKDRDCTVNFWDSHVPGLFSRLFLRRKPAVSDEYKLIILRDGAAFGPNSFSVDTHTHEALEAYFEDHRSEKTLDEKKWKIELKKNNGLLFLLKHPDPTTRTTAWVVLVTSIFGIVQSALFKR